MTSAKMTFTTHTGEIVEGERLTAALDAVSKDWVDLAHSIRAEDAYAAHVTEAQKAALLAADLAFAERIKTEGAKGFTVWQRVNEKLTGVCLALFAA